MEPKNDEQRPIKREVKQIIVKTAADILTPIALVFGIYVILHGTVSPGGGFQGGVIVAAAALLMYLGYGFETTSKVFRMDVFKKGEAFAAIVYVLLALAGIFFGVSFCENVFFEGTALGNIFASGTVSYMNYTVGFKVLTGVSFLLLLMLGMLAPDADEPEEMIDELPVEDVVDAIRVLKGDDKKGGEDE